jgi:hypothetical protein
VGSTAYLDALKKNSCSFSGIESQFLDRTACSLVTTPAEPSGPLYKLDLYLNRPNVSREVGKRKDMLLRLVLSQTGPRIWLSPVTTGCPSTILRLGGNSVCTIFFSEVMHGEYWAQREECQIVCIIRKAKRYLDDSVMLCFSTDRRVLFGEAPALVLGMQYCEWLSNCSESCHERQKSSSHSQICPSMMLAK